MRAIESALSNVALDSVGAIRSELRWCVNTGQIKPVPLEKYARVDAPRITARRARAVKKRLGEDEYFVYDKGVTPAERGAVNPTLAHWCQGGGFGSLIRNVIIVSAVIVSIGIRGRPDLLFM